jgi:hypothetical protein
LERLRRYSAPAVWGLLFVLILVLWWLGGWALPQYLAIGTTEKHGQFGDRFGAVNALFSALAFGGVLLALYLQWRDLQEQRDRLDRQNFETKFFQLLAIHNDIVTAIDLRGRGDAAVVATGRDCFRNFYDRKLKQAYCDVLARVVPHDVINVAYTDFFRRNRGDIGHYFQHLYHVLMFVDESSATEKKFYTDLLRAQLSTYEVALLFYHALSDSGHDLKPLVERYALLEHLSPDDLLAPAHANLYAEAAYGKLKAFAPSFDADLIYAFRRFPLRLSLAQSLPTQKPSDCPKKVCPTPCYKPPDVRRMPQRHEVR